MAQPATCPACMPPPARPLLRDGLYAAAAGLPRHSTAFTASAPDGLKHREDRPDRKDKDPGTRLCYGATPLGPEGSMVPRAETSLPKTDPKPTPLVVGVRGKALALRYPGAPLKP